MNDLQKKILDGALAVLDDCYGGLDFCRHVDKISPNIQPGQWKTAARKVIVEAIAKEGIFAPTEPFAKQPSMWGMPCPPASISQPTDESVPPVRVSPPLTTEQIKKIHDELESARNAVANSELLASKFKSCVFSLNDVKMCPSLTIIQYWKTLIPGGNEYISTILVDCNGIIGNVVAEGNNGLFWKGSYYRDNPVDSNIQITWERVIPDWKHAKK